MSTDSSKTTQIFFLCFAAILCLILFLSRMLEDIPRLQKYLSEPAMTLLVGITCSFLVREFWQVDESDLDAYDAQHNDGDDTVYDEAGNSNHKYYNYNEYGDYTDEYDQMLPQFFLYFPSNVFFLALLPPILFNSGYQLQRELFYRHFLPIALFAIVGTCLSAFGAGGFLVLISKLGWLSGSDFQPTVMELITFGSLIAATDTVSVVGVLQRKRVDPHLFSLVFGESALNDAVAIVLFKTAADFLKRNAQGEHENDSVGMLFGSYLLDLVIQAVVSPILGIVFAGMMGLAFKVMDFREHRMLEMSLYILPVYIPFILSELLDLSGMITIFFTGIFARRYMEPNVSPATREYSLALFQLLSFLAETCIFLELGLSVFGLHKSFYFPFIAWTFVAALLGRAFSVYPLSATFNFSLTRPVPVCGTDATVADTISSSSKTSSPNTSLFVMDDDLRAILGGDAPTTTAGKAVSGGDDPMTPQNVTEVETPTSNAPAAGTSSFFSLFQRGDVKLVSTTPTNGTNESMTHEQVGDDVASIASSKADGASIATTTTVTSLLSRRETPSRKRDKIIPMRFQHVLWFAGLRGAVAYACAREFPDVYGHKNEFIAATMVIVLITIVIMGGLCEDVMTKLKIRMNVDEAEYMRTWHKQRKLKGRFLHFEYNYIYRYVVRNENIRFMDESCGYIEHVDNTGDYRVHDYAFGGLGGIGCGVGSSTGPSPPSAVASAADGEFGSSVRRRGRAGLMKSDINNGFNNSGRTVMAGNNLYNISGQRDVEMIATQQQNDNVTSNDKLGSAYVAPPVVPYHPPSSSLSPHNGTRKVPAPLDHSLIDEDDNDLIADQVERADGKDDDIVGENKQNRSSLLSYSDEDLSERGYIESKLTPVLSNKSSFDHANDGGEMSSSRRLSTSPRLASYDENDDTLCDDAGADDDRHSTSTGDGVSDDHVTNNIKDETTPASENHGIRNSDNTIV